MSWTTLAAIGKVESGHGSANGARLGPDGWRCRRSSGCLWTARTAGCGSSTPIGGARRRPGPRQGARADAVHPDHLAGDRRDADNDGKKDPHDLDDAALAAGNYLCKGGRNLSIPGDWWNAILSYNDGRRYAQDVYDAANQYGRAGR